MPAAAVAAPLVLVLLLAAAGPHGAGAHDDDAAAGPLPGAAAAAAAVPPAGPGPSLQLWLSAMAASLAVSCVSLVAVAMLPLLAMLRGGNRRQPPPAWLVDAMACFAVGALLADAATHALPGAYASWAQAAQAAAEAAAAALASGGKAAAAAGGPHPAHGGLWASLSEQAIGLSVLAGIFAFYVLDRAVRAGADGASAGRRHGHGHSSGHSHAAGQGGALGGRAAGAKEDGAGEAGEREGSAAAALGGAGAAALLRRRKDSPPSHEGAYASSSAAAADGDGGGDAHFGPGAADRGSPPRMGGVGGAGAGAGALAGPAPAASAATAGYLNLLADGVHNLMDGLAIGAAFGAGCPSAGWARAAFMLAHELPQEIGDFGLLLRAGFGVAPALALNFASACTALVGTALALAVGGASPTSAALLEAFTAGSFLYIAGGVLADLALAGGPPRALLGQLLSAACGVAVVVGMHAGGGGGHGHGHGHAHGHHGDGGRAGC